MFRMDPPKSKVPVELSHKKQQHHPGQEEDAEGQVHSAGIFLKINLLFHLFRQSQLLANVHQVVGGPAEHGDAEDHNRPRGVDVPEINYLGYKM